VAAETLRRSKLKDHQLKLVVFRIFHAVSLVGGIFDFLQLLPWVGFLAQSLCTEEPDDLGSGITK